MIDPLAATSAWAPEVAIPNVDLLAPLGSGAFGTVYRARHRVLDVEVAVKIVRAEGRALERALTEARLMARLDHPNLLRIYDAGRNPEGLHLVLELMDAGSLEETRNLGSDALHDLATQLLSGLQALHDARIVHRDLKPANVLRRSDGRTKLADLGIAMEQRTQPEELAGTLAFMAPELFDGQSFGPSADLYALGMTLMCLALDEDPFPPGSASALLEWARRGERPSLRRERPDLPLALSGLVDQLVARDPSERPSSAASALAALSAPVARERLGSARVNAWMLGDLVYESPNWRTWVAAHATSGRPARLSRLRPDAPQMGGAHGRAVVLEGARRAAKWDHPGFLPVLDWGERDGTAYVVTAPQGTSLDGLIGAQGPLDEVLALTFAAELADALAYLHSLGLVYQVVEPGAVFLGQDARSVQLGWPWFAVSAGTPCVRRQGRLAARLRPTVRVA